ncbi:MAG: efflux RND transporter permease subunit [Steroidobacteraceae bacterium]
MWIVQIALRRPLTFIALSLLIVLLGIFTLARTAVDIFPSIDIPIVASVWYYSGLPPEDMANRIVLNMERNAQTTVTDLEHTESQSLNGMSVIKTFFQPSGGTGVCADHGRVGCQIRSRAAGYDATVHPGLQCLHRADDAAARGVQSFAHRVRDVRSVAQHHVRMGLSTVRGAAMPYPLGEAVSSGAGGPGPAGAARQQALRCWMSPTPSPRRTPSFPPAPRRSVPPGTS